MPGIIITATQSSGVPSLTDKQLTGMELSRFLRKNRLMDFKYDASQTNNNAKVTVFSKSIDTREVSGEIIKRHDGKDVFTLIIAETNDQTKRKFEDDAAGIWVGLKLRGSRQVSSRTQITKLPASKWGAMITLELDKSGDYELVIGSPAKPPGT